MQVYPWFRLALTKPADCKIAALGKYPLHFQVIQTTFFFHLAFFSGQIARPPRIVFGNHVSNLTLSLVTKLLTSISHYQPSSTITSHHQLLL